MTTTSPNSQENMRLEPAQPQTSAGTQMQSFEIELNLGGTAGLSGRPGVDDGAPHAALEFGIPGLGFIDESVGKLENLGTPGDLGSPEDLRDVNKLKELKDLEELKELENKRSVGVRSNGLSGVEPDLLSLPAALCDDLLLEEINSIPDKMGFKIGDVADLLGIKQYVLRYWESEFDILRPKKASNNQRMYSRKDVENAFLIRKLLHRDRFSIEGARNALKELKAYVRKEKDYTQVFVRLESFHERIEDLAREIRGLRRLFKT